MKKMLRTASLILAALLSCQIAAYAQTPGTIAVGKNTARTVTVRFDEDSRALLTLADGSMSRDASFKDHIATAEAVLGEKPSVSVNGTVFNAYYDRKAPLSFPGNCARVEQTLVSGGVTVSGGGSGYHSTLGFTKSGKVLIDYAQLQTYLTVGGTELWPWGVNEYYGDSSAVMYFTEHLGYPVDIPAAADVYTVRDGRIASAGSGGTYSVGRGEALIVVMPGYDFSAPVGAQVVVGRKVSVRFGNADDWNDLDTAVACDPFLLANGSVETSINTVHEDKMGNDFVAGRTFAAVDRDNDLTIGVVTASPNQIAEALKAAGYKDAMLLDGGGSSALASSDATYSSPSRLLSNVLHIAESTAGAPEIPFTDVGRNDIFYDSVKWAYENEITKGVSATLFGPSSACTRGQVVTFLYRAAGSPDPGDTAGEFSDVKETDYYFDAVRWAVSRGITNGVGGGRFAPGEPCTNAHILTFIWRFAGMPGRTAGPSSWYSDAMIWAEGEGMLAGLPKVDPMKDCPRSSVTYFLYGMPR